MLLLVLFGCHADPECADGEGIGIDGECVPLSGGADVAGVDLLPACELAEPGDRLDLVGGCADGACPGMTYEEIVAALGPEDEACSSSYCEWADGGIRAWFLDGDGATNLDVQLPWDGASPEGLAPGLSLACFLEELGPTDEIEYTAGSHDVIEEIWWQDIGLFVDDDDGDGLVDELTMFGA